MSPDVKYVAIGDFADVKGGKRLRKGKLVQDAVTDHPYIRVVDFREDGFDTSNVKYITEDAYSDIKRYIITDDDVYISIAGTIGRVGIIPPSFSNANLTENAAKITNIAPEFDKRFLMYYLRSDYKQAEISSKIVGTSQPKLALFRIKEIKVPQYSIIHQRKIAAILSAYDDLIENNTRRIQLLEEIAWVIYYEWFVKFRFPGYEKVKVVESELGEIPEGWEEKSVAEVCEFVSRGVTPDYQEKSGKFIINQKVNRGARLALENLKELNLDLIVPEDKYARKFDVLVNSLGEGTIGRVHLFRGPDKLWAVDQHMTILRSSNTANTLFLYMKLSSDEGQSKIESVKTGATNMTMLNISVLRNMTFLFPDQGLLKTFFKRVEPIYNLISYLENKNLNLAKTRVLLLPKLISGELNVSELDISTEELKP